jgi:hypothetical protein
MKKGLKIIFLDFNGTIDTPFRYNGGVGVGADVSHDFYPAKPKNVMTEKDYEELFREIEEEEKSHNEHPLGLMVDSRGPEDGAFGAGAGDDFDEQAWKAQEQMLLNMSKEPQSSEAWLAEKEMHAQMEQEAIEERKAIVEESKGRRIGDPCAEPENWIEKSALREEEFPGYVEVSELKKERPELFEYDAEGYDKNGYDKEGYDKWEFDRDGFAKDGYDSEGYDKDGFKKDGYDKRGFDRNGYNRYGFDHDGLDIEGFNSQGVKYTPFVRAGEEYTPSLPGIETMRQNKQTNKWDEHRKRQTFPEPVFYKDEANPDCVKYLKALVEETGAKIVYSTTRRYAGWESCARYIGLPLDCSLGGEAGITPTSLPKETISPIDWFKKKFGLKKPDPANWSWKPRQREIKAWLEQWKGEKIESYVILDDDPITDPEMSKHWIPSVADNRFGKEEYEQALKILAKRA